MFKKTIVDHVDNLEDRSRRNNFKFEGIVEYRGENWEQAAVKTG